MALDERRIALLIDADNAPAAKIDVILAEVARHGTANVRRAYGDWKSPTLKPGRTGCTSYAIRPVQQFAYSRGKNASDMAMVIDAMDLLYDGTMDGFARSSRATRTSLRWSCGSSTAGVKVYGFGQTQDPGAVRQRVLGQFTYVEALGAEIESPRRPRSAPTRRSCVRTGASSSCCAAE